MLMIPALLTLSFLSQTPQTPAAPPAARPAPAMATLDIRVTDRTGAPIEGARVAAEGPVGRESKSDGTGLVSFKSLAAGTYRFRVERDGFVALEKEVVVVAGKAGSVEAALTSAPPPPPPPAPVPSPAPATLPSSPLMPGIARTVSITDFAEKNLIDKEPTKETAIGCSGASAARLIQAREAIAAHVHADADEMLYVVAGEATLKMGTKEQNVTSGWFAIVPRGTEHTLTRKGKNPVIVLSILSGPACPTATPAPARR